MTTIKWILLFFVSIVIGTFVNQVLENINTNIWISRAASCLVSGIVAILLYKYFSKE